MRKLLLTSEQKNSIPKALNDTTHKIFIQRLHFILLASNLSLIARELSIHFEVSRKTIYHWFNLWERGGLDSLCPKKRVII